jgi:hypothetical protein
VASLTGPLQKKGVPHWEMSLDQTDPDPLVPQRLVAHVAYVDEYGLSTSPTNLDLVLNRGPPGSLAVPGPQPEAGAGVEPAQPSET